MGQLIKLSVKSGALLHSAGVGAGFRFCTRYIDLLVIPWLLNAGMLYAYLVARGASLCVPVLLGLLGRKVAPHLVRFAQAEQQSAFRAAAARVNLSYMMVCGGVALMVMSIAPYLVKRAGGLDSAFDDILIWLVIGQSAPVLFGATSLLMQAVERGVFYDLLLGVTAMLFLAGIWMLNPQDGVLIAQTFAAAQLAQAAICALLLTQCGVWPGLTALFHKEIKLF